MYFNDNIAKKYGFAESIILQCIYNWCNYNRKNNKNNFDNSYWMFNTNKEFLVELPYLKNINTIRTAIKTLKDEGLILTGNYNNTCTRTTWYTVTEKALSEMMLPDNVSNDNPEEDTPTKPITNVNNAENSNKECDNQQSVMLNSEIRIDENNNTYLQKQQLILLNPAIRIAENSNITNNITTNNNTINLEKEIHKEKEDPVRCVYDFWNSKNLIKCSELTPSLKGLISKVLKSFTLDEVILCITRYDEALNSSYWLEHRWSLKSFLSQSNALPEFRDGGEKWINLAKWLESKKSAPQSNFIHNNYTQDEIDSFITNLDDIEL